MYIEFRLPEVPDEFNHGANMATMCIESDINEWVRKYNIQYHKIKRHKFTLRLVLENANAYSYFALTWNPSYHFSKNFIFKEPK